LSTGGAESIHTMVLRCRRVLRVASATAVLSLALASTGSSTTWVVDASGSGDFTGIQDGVAAAAPGDTVLVLPGFYHERVRIIEKHGLCLLGGGPVESVVISADSIAVDVRRTDPPARIEGLTLTGSTWFGALFTMQARVEVVGCVFRDNTGPGGCLEVGGAINAMLSSDLLIEDCVIEDNSGWEAPGGVIIWQSRADIRRNVFRGNTACYGGGLEIYHCETEPVSYIEDNLFIGNSVSDWGGAIFTVDSSPVIHGNTFYANNASGSTAIWVLGGHPDISGNIIVDSHWGVYCQSHPQYPASLPVMGCNLFWDVAEFTGSGCPGAGSVIEADPLFCDPVSEDFSLCADSPAISDSCGLLGAYGEGCPACGSVSTESSTWGALKSLYR
jgi:hypothetical protein